MESDGVKDGGGDVNLGDKIEENEEIEDEEDGDKKDEDKDEEDEEDEEEDDKGQRLVTLKRKLENVEESFKAKTVKQDKFVQNLKDKIECPVCYEIPRCGPVPICPNGHIVCIKCKRDACPTCRTLMGDGKSLIAVAIIEAIDHTCKFDDCEKLFPFGDTLKKHETNCPLRTVNCPKTGCNEKVALAGMVKHLLQSPCCAQKDRARQGDLNVWHTASYNNTKHGPNANWSIDVCEINGEVFVFFPLKSEGFFYFMFIMGATESKCIKYVVEMVVHGPGTAAEAVDDKVAARFSGIPLSIDRQKEEFKLFGTTSQLMKEIMKMSRNKHQFRLSFKIVKQ